MEGGQTVVIARTARWKAGIFLAIFLALTWLGLMGLALGRDFSSALTPLKALVLSGVSLLFALGAVIFASPMLRPQEVWLSPEGLTTTKWRKIIRWSEVESFHLGAYNRPSWPWSDRLVFLRFKAPSDGFLRNRQRFGHDSAMPKLLNIAPAKLVKILEDWRLRYG